jgi:hypothetical protein
MECIAPPPLRQADLLRYQDESATRPEVTRHLAECIYCRQQAERLAELQRSLRAGLYRRQCPPAQALGEFQLDLLPAEEETVIRRHVERCPHCRQELESLDDFMTVTQDELKVESAPRWRKIIAQLISPPSQGPSLGAQTSPALRGAGADNATAYVADDVQVSLAVQDDRDHPGQRALIGIITQASRPEQSAEGTSLQLRQDGRAIAWLAADNLGSFVFGNLSRGQYDVALFVENAEIIIQAIHV